MFNNRKRITFLVVVFLVVTVSLVVIFWENVDNLASVDDAPKENKETKVDIIASEPSDWTLTWSDEFDIQTIDPKKWDFDLGNTLRGTNVPGWGNEELQYYTNKPKNVSVENGYLIITGLKEKDTTPYRGIQYTSARLVTRGLFYQKYGKFEIRAKLPLGTGLWPAFWMLPEYNEYGTWAASGEIDIMEARGRLPYAILGTIHYGGEWPRNRHTGGTYFFPEGQNISQFHTYSIIWSQGEIRWYVNDIHYLTLNEWYTKDEGAEEPCPFPAPFDQPFHLIMNLAIGGRFDGNRVPPDDVFPAVMKVDYVRVYSYAINR